MDVKLDDKELEVVRRVLTNYLGDLRMEVAGTDSYEFRQGLKEDEEVIKTVLKKLPE